MALTAPNLDTRTFEQLLAEVRRRIPRYTPEWTDHNESDPGIALAQLFSWLTELMLFQVNQVPERNYIKFLELLGIQLRAATPATAELTFETARDDVEYVIVPRGAQAAAAGDDDAPVVFEAAESLIALGAKLAAVQSYDGFGYTLVTKRNEADGQTFEAFGPHAREGAALVLGFDSPLAFTSQQINLAVYVSPFRVNTEGIACDLDRLGVPPPADLVWEYWDRKLWRPLNVGKDETRAFTRDGHIYLSGPGAAVKKAFLGAEKGTELYWLRCRLVRSGYDTPPKLDRILTNTVRARQSVTIRDEILGGSAGRPNQRFLLASPPVLTRERPLSVKGPDGLTVTASSLLLEVNEGASDAEFAAWQEVDDFFASGPDDPHYTLDRAAGEVRFGDGRRGRIPLANPDNPAANIVARSYLTGGGKHGNVGAATITELQSYVEGIASVTNLRPSFGGRDEETLDEAKLRAPQELKAKGRAVTAEDFETLAMEAPGANIARAKALPNTHPKFPGASIPGAVTVIVVPDTDDPAPIPGEDTLRAVCACLDESRLITTELHVAPPTYHHVEIEVDLVAAPDADLAEVQGLVAASLEIYFHPLKGGDDGAGWPFGGDIFYSKVYRRLLEVVGVDRVKDNRLFVHLDGERQPACTDTAIEAGRLVYSTGHQIRIEYDREDDR